MHAPWFDMWGSARGSIGRLAPPTRMVAGLLCFCACLSAPVWSLAGGMFTVVAVTGWLLACRPPHAILRAASLFGLVLFLPALLMAPLIRVQPGAPSWPHACEIAGSLFIRGFSGMLVSLTTVTTLSMGDLREGLLRLPVPRIVSAILLQIIHQTVTLLEETRQVTRAMAIRGASGQGRAAWRVMLSLPQVWLPRVLLRADQVAAAMELRGYDVAGLPTFRRPARGAADVCALMLTGGGLALALGLRWWGPTP